MARARLRGLPARPLHLRLRGRRRKQRQPRPISVSHLPPGTSKWNKIEHGRFSFISKNWRREPLLTSATIRSLIAATTTTKGLEVHACLDAAEYPAKVRITDQQMTQIRLVRDTFHGEWHYSILPRGRADESVAL